MKKDRFGVVFRDRQKIVRAGQPNPTRQFCGLKAVRRQPAWVQRQHGGVIGASAMPHDIDFGRIDGQAIG